MPSSSPGAPARAPSSEPIRNSDEREARRGTRRNSNFYLLLDDVLLLLLEEEEVELVELGVEEADEPGLLQRHPARRRRRRHRHRRRATDATPLARPLPGGAAGDEVEALLEVLVGEEVVAPLRLHLHDLAAQALAELHRSLQKIHTRKPEIGIELCGIEGEMEIAGGVEERWRR